MNQISTHVIAIRLKFIYAAGAFLILMGISISYLYVRATAENLFNQHYHPYQAHVSRGNNPASAVREAYRKGEMEEVIAKFKDANDPAPEEYLLTGVAFLEKKQPKKAIKVFRALIDNNRKSNSDFFEEDAEYYLAMSYLSNNESDKAMTIFEKIQSDPESKYNNEVSEWFMLNLRTAIAKQ
jgi:tetratricopeptide (TPR) repeat protein